MSIITANQIKSISGTARNVDSLIESTELKTINGTSIVGSGNIDVTAGSHTHDISGITNLQTTMNGKQATLVSGTNIKTIAGTSIVGSGDIASVPPSAHTHTTTDVTGLQTALNGKQDTLVSGTNIKTVGGVSIVGSGNVDVTTGLHTHDISGVTGLQSALDSKQATLVSGTNIKTVGGVSIVGSGNIDVTTGSHTHTISDVTNLQATLDNKQPTLVSGTNIKTVNGTSILGSGDLTISGGASGSEKLLTEFGAIGDGSSANASTNTTAITSALAYIASTGKNVVIPYGTFVCEPFSINLTSYASQGTFVGLDRERCILKRNTNGAGAFVTIGSSSGTIFQSGVGMRNLKIDGGVQSNGPALLCYDVVRSAFDNCYFSGGSKALSMLGGISVDFNSCLFDAAAIGVHIDKFTSSAGGGWPNLIRFNGGEIVDNSLYGLWFDAGRSVILTGIDVEGNGTTPGTSGQGGAYVGPNVGQEVSINDPYSIGLVVNSCWFEANRGASDLLINSGNSMISGTTFFSTSAQVTNDITINGGQYSLRDVNCSFSKSYNLIEGGSVLPGTIISSQIPNISRVNSGTMVIGGGGIDVRGGVVPIVKGISTPTIQAGSAITGGSGTVTVSFPYAFTSLTSIVCTCFDGTPAADTIGIRVLSYTTSSFTVFTTRVSGGGSVAAGTIAFAWQAVGTA